MSSELQCCLYDKPCTGAAPGCTGATDPLSPTCRDLIANACSSNLDLWTTDSASNCQYQILRNVFTAPNGTPRCNNYPILTETVCGSTLSPDLLWSAPGTLWASEVLEGAVATFTASGYRFGSAPTEDTYHPFQQILQNICCSYPALCPSALRLACQTVQVEDILRNENLASLCGCFLDPEVYKPYLARFGVTPECSPLCNRASAVPITDNWNRKVECRGTLCLIDHVNLTIVDSTVNRDINITQYCSSCRNGSCNCVLSDVDYTVSNTLIGGSVNLTQACGSLTCSETTNELGQTLPCTAIPEAANSVNIDRTGLFITLGGALMVGIMLLLLFLFLRRR